MNNASLYLIEIFFFTFGCICGSLLNVLIIRLPESEDVVFKRSHCRKCLKNISWYENIPIFSFVVLRGRCSQCRNKISIQYPIVEILTGFISLLLYNFFYFQMHDYYDFLNFLFTFSIGCIFIIIAVVDLRYRIIPDEINLFLAGICLIQGIYQNGIAFSLIGGCIGLFFPLLFTWGYYKLSGKVGLGGGDIKLFGALGLYLGGNAIMSTIFFSCLIGTIVGIPIILISKEGKNFRIPFGPFIMFSAMLQILFPSLTQEILIKLFSFT